jgi:hypothetical protein
MPFAPDPIQLQQGLPVPGVHTGIQEVGDAFRVEAQQSGLPPEPLGEGLVRGSELRLGQLAHQAHQDLPFLEGVEVRPGRRPIRTAAAAAARVGAARVGGDRGSADGSVHHSP